MPYDAVVFDMDGVLLTGFHTPREVYERATERVLAEYGIGDPPASLRHPDGIEGWRRACEEHGISPEAAWRRRERASNDLEAELIADGGRAPFDDVDVLDELDAPLGIVSNNRQGTVDFVVDHFDLGMDAAYGRAPTFAGYRRMKPDPHYLDRALADLGAAPDAALYVGDRRSDVETARNAGTDAALLARDGVPEGDPDPEYVIESLDDLSGLV